MGQYELVFFTVGALNRNTMRDVGSILYPVSKLHGELVVHSRYSCTPPQSHLSGKDVLPGGNLPYALGTQRHGVVMVVTVPSRKNVRWRGLNMMFAFMFVPSLFQTCILYLCYI
jgi:hypothetical protein